MQINIRRKLGKFYMSFVLFLLGIAIGLFIAVQIQVSQNITRTPNPVTPNLELKKMADKIEKEQENLKNEIVDLRKNIEKQEEEIRNKQKISKELSEELKKYKNLIGLTNLKGEGVKVTLSDGEVGYIKDRTDLTKDSIIHSTDILDVVNLLWLAGAEAVAVNDQRVVSTTSIDCMVNNILVNEVHIESPFIITAIGDKDKLEEFLNDPGRLPDIYERNRGNQIKFEIEKRKDLYIKAFDESYTVENARLL